MKRGLEVLCSLLGLTTVLPITLGYATSCKKDDSIKEIKWKIPEKGVTVEVIGQKKLITSIKQESELQFKVTVENNYLLDKVTANNKTIKAEDDIYKVVIKTNTTISVKITEEVSSLEITTKPTKLIYFAGDRVDVTGMKVKATYKTGRIDEDLKKGSTGYSLSTSKFEGGENSFDVSYGGLTQTVNLDDVVRYKVTIDPDGGKISDDWKNKYNKNEHIKGFTEEDDGSISFSYYTDLDIDIVLPEKK